MQMRGTVAHTASLSQLQRPLLERQRHLQRHHPTLVCNCKMRAAACRSEACPHTVHSCSKPSCSTPTARYTQVIDHWMRRNSTRITRNAYARQRTGPLRTALLPLAPRAPHAHVRCSRVAADVPLSQPLGRQNPDLCCVVAARQKMQCQPAIHGMACVCGQPDAVVPLLMHAHIRWLPTGAQLQQPSPAPPALSLSTTHASHLADTPACDMRPTDQQWLRVHAETGSVC